MTSKKSRDTSKSKHSSKDDYREDKHRGSSKDYEQEVPSTRHKDKSDSHKSKSKHSSKTNDYDQDAVALPDEEEEHERRRRKKLRKQLEEEERLKREEDERLKREQEEYEEERRRRKEKNRDVENGDSRKHKSSRVKSPRSPSPPPAPSKHKSKGTEKDDNYSDDFEQNYDDDFDDEPAPPPVKKSSSSYKEEKYNSTYDESPKTKSYSSSTTTGVNEVQVYANTRRFHSHDISDRIRRRYKDLSRLITLDRQSFNILDMAPMPAHAAYMRDIRLSSTKNQSTDNNDGGTGWTANIKVQTNDDAEHVQSQTDEIDTRSMWTQHPSENQNKSCGSGNTNDENQFSDINKTRENEELLRMLRLETDLGRYQTFVTNAGKLMLALLDDQQTTSTKSNSKRSKDNDEQDGMQRESDLNFSSGLTILPGLSFKS
ncbi:unnamed protein product, partial [Adineta steineri]